MDAETQAVIKNAWDVVRGVGTPGDLQRVSGLEHALEAHAKAHPPELPKASETPPARQTVHFAHAIGDRVRINPFDKTHEALAAIGTICALTLCSNGSQRFSVYYPGQDPSERLADFGADELSPPGHYATTVNITTPKHPVPPPPPPPNETTTEELMQPVKLKRRTPAAREQIFGKKLFDAAVQLIHDYDILPAEWNESGHGLGIDLKDLRLAVLHYKTNAEITQQESPSPNETTTTKGADITCSKCGGPATYVVGSDGIRIDCPCAAMVAPPLQPTILQLKKGDVCVLAAPAGVAPPDLIHHLKWWEGHFPGVEIRVMPAPVQVLRPAKGGE